MRQPHAFRRHGLADDEGVPPLHGGGRAPDRGRAGGAASGRRGRVPLVRPRAQRGRAGRRGARRAGHRLRGQVKEPPADILRRLRPIPTDRPRRPPATWRESIRGALRGRSRSWGRPPRSCSSSSRRPASVAGTCGRVLPSSGPGSRCMPPRRRHPEPGRRGLVGGRLAGALGRTRHRATCIGRHGSGARRHRSGARRHRSRDATVRRPTPQVPCPSS